jgi:hypothetical protein
MEEDVMCGALKQYTFCVLHDMKIEFLNRNNKAVFFFNHSISFSGESVCFSYVSLLTPCMSHDSFI